MLPPEDSTVAIQTDSCAIDRKMKNSEGRGEWKEESKKGRVEKGK